MLVLQMDGAWRFQKSGLAPSESSEALVAVVDRGAGLDRGQAERSTVTAHEKRRASPLRVMVATRPWPGPLGGIGRDRGRAYHRGGKRPAKVLWISARPARGSLFTFQLLHELLPGSEVGLTVGR